MFAKERLKDLESQQDLLVVQADLHRRLLGLEAAAIQERFGWVTAVGAPLQAGRKWLLPVAVVSGLVAAWRWRRVSRWLPIAFAAWRFVRRFNEQ